MPKVKSDADKKVAHKTPLASAIGGAVNNKVPASLALQKSTNDNSWKEIEDVHTQCVVLMATTTELRHLIANKELSSKLKDVEHVSKLANVLLKDLTDFSNKLNAIKSSYLNIDKSTKDEMDVLAIVAISEQYFNWMSSFQGVVLPTAGEIQLAYLEINGENVGG